MAALRKVQQTNVRLSGGASSAPSNFVLMLICDGIHQLDGVQMLLFTGDEPLDGERSAPESGSCGLEQEGAMLHMAVSGAGR